MERGDRVVCFSTNTVFRIVIFGFKSSPGKLNYTTHHIPNAASASRDGTDKVGTSSAQATRHNRNGPAHTAAAG